jgi:hypothetical protein
MQPAATRIPGSSICIGIVAGASALPFGIRSRASSLEDRGRYGEGRCTGFGIQWALAIVPTFIAEAFWPGITSC